MDIGLRSSLTLTIVAALAVVAFAQRGVNPALQAGVSVQLPATSNAVAIPNADNPNALVVAVTADGTTYLGVNPLTTSALAESVRKTLSTRNDKTLYIKADGRAPHARVIDVIDAVRNSGVDGLTFITAQQGPAGPGGAPVAPKGLEMRVLNRRP